ncbi:MAG: aminotransferase class V-fold PLP-dependent enzyme [Provencibacterium sp.]|nr:aminotransferase class V-fold PLP-dependent enzyme [Provencibacterium sp.]
MVYFDNAATSFPKPRMTVEAANAAFTRYGANPGRGGHRMALETSQMVFRAREQLAQLMGMDAPENVVFTLNCTQASNQAIKGVVREGDHVIISSMEHNSVRRPVEALKKAGVCDYDVARVEVGDPAATVRNFRALLRPNTRLICCVHGSNVFGTIQPVEALCALAHENGALFLLDAAQTAGVLSIRFKELPADFICLACHKGLYAPTALGALLVGGQAELNTLLEGGSGSLSLETDMPPFLPDRLEAGTVNTTGIAGLTGGLRFVRLRTIPRIYREEMELTHRLYQGLSEIKGVTLYNRPGLPVLSFGIEGMTGEAAAGRLGELGYALRGGFHCSPLAHETMGTLETGTARIGVGAFNTAAQAEGLLRAVRRVVKET